MKICGLLGQNISYSKSPDIHNDFYRENNIGLRYSVFDVAQKDLSTFMQDLNRNNIIGFNVTIPYKETIIKYLDILHYPANKILAVNTVLIEENSLSGYNTDYYGFLDSLTEINFNFNECSALIIGSGGAAKAVAHVLMDNNCRSLAVMSRNKEKAESYFSEYCEIYPMLESKNLKQYNLIVNCTPVGSASDLDSIPIGVSSINEDCLVYDLIYSPPKTKFLSFAEKKGAKIMNGEKMLRLQAYKADEIFIDNLNRIKARKK